MKYQVVVEALGNSKEISVDEGANLWQILVEHGYEVPAYCGGSGVCGKCKVQVEAEDCLVGQNSEKRFGSHDKVQETRLACSVVVKDNLRVKVEPPNELVVLTSGLVSQGIMKPRLKKEFITLSPPTLADQMDYANRIHTQIGTNSIVTSALIQLGSISKEEGFTVVVYQNKILKAEPGNTTQKFYGIAMDIGTTTIAIYLVNLQTGREVGVWSMHNPQQKYGADVVSRINYTLQEAQGRLQLQKVLLAGINGGIKSLAAKHKVDPQDIVAVSLVANTVITHLLLGVNAITIANAPYVPIFSDGLQLTALELGLDVYSQAIISIPPAVVGYVGSDIIADLLMVNLELNNYGLLIDLGTNGEIVLGGKGKILACSTAAGPAFEGTNITFGMAGVQGAISSMKLADDGNVEYAVIGNIPPKGICGSGLVDGVAELLRHGLIDEFGTFVEYSPLVTDFKGLKALRIVAASNSGTEDDIFLTQKDVREFQLAKGAVAAGITILLQEMEISKSEVSALYLAGGFGNYVNPRNACVTGIIPRELEDRVIRIGNGAGAGSKRYLLDQAAVTTGAELQKKIQYVELSSRLDFQTQFVDAMMFE